MSINKVNTTVEEQSFKFLTNQSSILHTVETNNITVNGVNVIVDKPKRGDIMCITHYKEGGILLDADKQKVVWIDGLSINPKQLSQEYEPVGICLVVKGNKAIVRYREEKGIRWSAGERWELPNSSIMNDGAEHTLKITLNGVENPTSLVLTSADTTSRKAFVDKLNAWFLANDKNYSAELVELNTDLPAVDTTDDKDGDSYRNRVIVNARFTESNWNTINIEGIGAGTRAIGKHIKAVNWYYKNNGFTSNNTGGCCRAKYYDYIQGNQKVPTGPMTSINSVPDTSAPWPLYAMPAKKADFDSDSNCQLLRDNFANYDEYLESWMAKFPCGAGGTITEFPSGKENTYNLANCTFLDNAKGEQSPLYLAANWAASISLNAPKLGKGNWWLPSSAEITEIMRDITYNTSFWTTKPDIINRVLAKLTSISNSGWSMLSASTYRWTSSRYDQSSAYHYYGSNGVLNYFNFYVGITVAPITLYEF